LVILKKLLIFSVIIFISKVATCQVVNTAVIDTSASVRIGAISIGGYVDTYYTYNFSQIPDKNIPYLTASARHNEMNINLAFLDLRYSSSRIRARLVAGFGTFMMVNYVNEPVPLKFLLEASVGVKPFKNYDAWIYAGILGSPFTNESYLSKDHLMYTRSLAAENVPYYLTGFKVQLPIGKKLTLSLYGLNGWQNISENGDGKAAATQLEYNISSNLIFNWNTYIGDEKTDSTPNYRLRAFTDIFFIYSKKKFDLTSSAYIGVQMREDSLKNITSPIWYSGNVIARYQFNKTFSISGRVEYFRDAQNVLVRPTTTNKQFHVLGGGICLNFHLWENFMFRVEGRGFYGFNKIYRDMSGNEVNYNGQLTGSFSAWF
jgi:hypothetical protein